MLDTTPSDETGSLIEVENFELLIGIACRAIIRAIDATKPQLHQRRFSLVLSGGVTPIPIYERLATRHLKQIPWERLEIFWGDERFVPPDNPSSNQRMARESLLNHVPIPPEHIHPIPTNTQSPEESANLYCATLERVTGAAIPTFDLVLLGIGKDGHTASLFPGDAAIDVRDRSVAAATAPSEPHERVTLTFPVLKQARRTILLASGEDKANLVRQIESDAQATISQYPAAILYSIAGSLWVISPDTR